MKAILSFLIAVSLAGSVLAQAPARPATKPVAKAPAAKPANDALEADPGVELNEAEQSVAEQVHTGELQCELGAKVQVTPHPRKGYFLVTTRNHRFRMHPVESRTGAIRLEDRERGAVWIQLSNKSMLMSQKLGQRLADECQSPTQVAVAEQLKKNPAPSLLDPVTPRPAEGGSPVDLALVY